MKDLAAERSWRHLDAIHLQIILTAWVPRCSCERCGGEQIAAELPDKHSRLSLLFDAFEMLHQSQSIRSPTLLLGIDWMKRSAARGLERRSLEKGRHVGIEIKTFGESQDEATVMTDIDQPRVLEVTPDRTRESADELWKTTRAYASG